MKNAIAVTRPADVKLEYLPYRFPQRSAVTIQAELRQIATCVYQNFPTHQSLLELLERRTPVLQRYCRLLVRHGLVRRPIPRLPLQPLQQDTLSVVGYGPTLRETWDQITHPCLTVSGAHDFLLSHGIVPDLHAECDGRDHKTKHLEHPHPNTRYLMASICNPRMWQQLEGHHVVYWHNANGQHVVDWISGFDDGSLLVAGGSVIGNTALHLAGVLGFRKFRLFGFDAHMQEGQRHAGAHYGPPQKLIPRRADGRIWTTTPQMSNAADELVRLADLTAGNVSFDVVGDSLQAALFRDLAVSRRFWEQRFAAWDPSWERHIEAIVGFTETLRPKAKYNTGSVPRGAAVALKALTAWIKPEVAIEVGTFIGTSTLSMEAGHIYTCDHSNDCLPSDKTRTCHPYLTSTKMLGKLVKRGIKAEFMFFDGRIQPPDLALILRCSTPTTVYAFDDYLGYQKGVVNIQRLWPFLPTHRLIEPVGIVRDTMTIACLVPESRL